MNCKRKSRRRFFLLVRSRTPPISSEFRGGVWTTQTPPLGTPLPVTFPPTFQFLIIFGMGFEVLTVVRIHNVVWVRTTYSLVHTRLQMFWRSILGLSTRTIGLRKQYVQAKFYVLTLHGPTTEKTTVLNHNVIHFSYIMSFCYKKLAFMSGNT